MDFGRIIKSLSLGQIVAITLKVLSSPLMFYCFVKATKKCMAMCDKRFGKAHHKNNKANAYRHALWNMAIAHQCIKKGKVLSESLRWAEEMTNWHEKAFVNNPIETQMDLHNNEMGRRWFEEIQTVDPERVDYDIMDRYLMEKLENAKKVTNNDLQNNAFGEHLVFIEAL